MKMRAARALRELEAKKQIDRGEVDTAAASGGELESQAQRKSLHPSGDRGGRRRRVCDRLHAEQQAKAPIGALCCGDPNATSFYSSTQRPVMVEQSSKDVIKDWEYSRVQGSVDTHTSFGCVVE